jgi:lipopolysaccharide/colanic/teichoic acid biosynthesis glycosyltransferase
MTPNGLLKRVLDIVAGSVALVIASPVMLLISVAIRLDSPGPALFTQNRLGREGRHFQCFKFRTMMAGADGMLESLFLEKPDLQREWANGFKLREDPRATRLGRFLRRTSLDELPQLVNVLKGDMSLVGPRPRPLYEADQAGNEESFGIGLRVRPGITGLWQVSGRGSLDFGSRINLDAMYVRRWSLWLDIEILLRTIPVVLSQRNAY